MNPEQIAGGFFTTLALGIAVAQYVNNPFPAMILAMSVAVIALGLPTAKAALNA